MFNFFEKNPAGELMIAKIGNFFQLAVGSWQ